MTSLQEAEHCRWQGRFGRSCDSRLHDAVQYEVGQHHLGAVAGRYRAIERQEWRDRRVLRDGCAGFRSYPDHQGSAFYRIKDWNGKSMYQEEVIEGGIFSSTKTVATDAVMILNIAFREGGKGGLVLELVLNA